MSASVSKKTKIKQLPASQQKQIDQGKTPSAIQNGDDLAMAALSQVSQQNMSGQDSDLDEEVAKSDKLAETLTSLQNLIERNAAELKNLSIKIRDKKESLRDIFTNDQQLEEAQQQVTSFSEKLKERKSQLQANPQVTALKVEVSELSQQRKEIEESLSNYLLNYYSLTQSTSIDTSDGDQWDFQIKAKLKAKDS